MSSSPRSNRPRKRRQPDTPPSTEDAADELLIPWSSSPPRIPPNIQQDDAISDKQSDRDLAGPNIEGPLRAERFTLKSIRTKLGSIPPFPKERDQSAYTASHPLIFEIRMLIRARSGICTLCPFYEWSQIVATHKLKYCGHRKESKDVAPWLEMFRLYRAKGGGPGARCEHCRFPLVLCWRTAYREKMDAKHGNEVEARENDDVLYDEVRCGWVKTIQRFTTGCLVVGGRRSGAGVNELGEHILGMMGWEDWEGLEEHGPEYIKEWLEEMDVVEGLRCPRLLKLFWLLAKGS